MSDSVQQANVTKREFNSALSLVWLFIMIAMGARMQVEPGWSSGVLFVAAFLAFLAYTVASIRRRRKPIAGSGDWTTDAKQLLAAGDKIGAITTVRNGTKMGLREAKDLVESWMQDPERRSDERSDAG